MEKEISFNEGLRLTPYSDVSPDGELSVCHNVEVYGGGLRPTVIEGKKFTVRTGQESVMTGELMHIHATGEYQHLIFQVTREEGDELHWCLEGKNDGEVTTTRIVDAEQLDITSVSSVGNVLVVTTKNEVYYALWKQNGYVWLGAMPELKVKLEGEFKQLSVDNWVEAQTPEQQYNLIAKGIKTFEKKWCEEERMFVYPFLVRAAYRLYDGTWTKPTPPVLLCPNVNMPIAGYMGMTSEGNQYQYRDIYGFAAKLYGTFNYGIRPASLLPSDGWENVIAGVDVFVSEPLDPWIYDYTGEGKDEYTYKKNDYVIWTDCYFDQTNPLNTRSHIKGYGGQIKKSGEQKSGIADYFMTGFERYDTPKIPQKVGSQTIWVLSPYSNNEVYALKRKTALVYRGMMETGAFYKVFSMSKAQMENSEKEILIELEKGVYANIVQQERLKVDEDSVDRWGGDVSFVYNRRITIGALTRSIFRGEVLERLAPKLEPAKTYTKNGTTQSDDAAVEETTAEYYEGDSEDYYYDGENNDEGQDVDADVDNASPAESSVANLQFDCYWIRNENGTESWAEAGFAENEMYRWLNYLYTPDMYATAFVMISKEGDKWLKFPLSEHPFLQGRFFCGVPFESEAREYETGIVPTHEVVDSLTRMEASTLRTSGVNNPFVFGAEGWNTVGNGRVLALTSITKALSEGQFGQFPLMALCTDGNYALEVIKSGEKAGLYGGASAMPRDVCINRESVTQIDGAILFVSNRGVMMADGNDIRCISESLNGPMERSLLMAVTQEDVYEGQGEKLRDFFETCRIIWDYTSQRAIFFQDNNNFALQYRDGAWSSIGLPQQFKGVQNIYPYSYIYRDDGTVLVLDDDYNFGDTMHDGVVETRPLKMDTLQMKKLCEFALQGRFEGEQTVTLFGSNDMTNWDVLGTTTRRRVPHVVGRWYKYWRFLIQAKLKESEHISGLRIRYDVRGETRVR